MTHRTRGAGSEPPLHGALEQDRRERDWDRTWGPIEALRETRHLGPVVGTLVLTAIGVYIAAWLAGRGDPLGGLVIGGVAIVGGALTVDTELCKGTPAHVHECRRCRRATDRWRGPTRDDLWATSLVGQSSAAARTPSPKRYRQPAGPEPWTWDGYPERAVRTVVESQSVTAEAPDDGTSLKNFGEVATEPEQSGGPFGGVDD